MPTFTYKDPVGTEIEITPLRLEPALLPRFIICVSHKTGKEIALHENAIKVIYTSEEIQEYEQFLRNKAVNGIYRTPSPAAT